MIGRATEFATWCDDIRDRFERAFSFKPNPTPNLVNLTSAVQERIMRCAVEARFFGIDDHSDDLAILAHHTLLKDDLRFHGSRRSNFIENLYGYQEKEGQLA
jgi:hypothetical protein